MKSFEIKSEIRACLNPRKALNDMDEWTDYKCRKAMLQKVIMTYYKHQEISVLIYNKNI